MIILAGGKIFVGGTPPLVGRFQRKRWSKTRTAIDGLKVGASVTFPESEHNNATTSIQRLAEAYAYKRGWSINKVEGGWRVTRTK